MKDEFESNSVEIQLLLFGMIHQINCTTNVWRRKIRDFLSSARRLLFPSGCQCVQIHAGSQWRHSLCSPRYDKIEFFSAPLLCFPSRNTCHSGRVNLNTWKLLFSRQRHEKPWTLTSGSSSFGKMHNLHNDILSVSWCTFIPQPDIESQSYTAWKQTILPNLSMPTICSFTP